MNAHIGHSAEHATNASAFGASVRMSAIGRSSMNVQLPARAGPLYGAPNTQEMN